MSNQLIVTEEGRVTLVVESQPAPEIVVEATPDITIEAPIQEAELIVVSERGPQGPPGIDGAGVTPGGTTGQLMAKASDLDYDTEWIDVPPSLFRGEWHPATVRLVDQVLTSDTTPSPYVAISFGPGYSGSAWNLFDRIAATGRQWSMGSPPFGVTIDLGSAKRLDTYDLDATYVDTWTIDGSNDGTTWTTIETRSGQPVTTNATYTLASPATYRYFRLNCTLATGGYPKINEWTLWGALGDEPYMTGEFVIYNGRLWKSASSNNGTVPGAVGATWTLVPLIGTVLLEAGQTAADVPTNTPVGTIVFRKG